MKIEVSLDNEDIEEMIQAHFESTHAVKIFKGLKRPVKVIVELY
jgi:hypothetical protein